MRRASTAPGGTRLKPRDLAVASSRHQPNGHRDPTGVIGISALCRLPDHSYVVGSTSLPPGHNTGATDFLTEVEAPLSSDNSREMRPEISEGSTFSNLREVIMTMSEYEERFRPPAQSLHQTLAQVRGSNRRGRRNRRLWVAAALVGVVTITSKAALHHSTYADGSQITGIQACDHIHR